MWYVDSTIGVLYREFTIFCTEALGATNPATIRAIVFLASHLEENNILQEAEAVYRDLVEVVFQLLKESPGQFILLNPIHGSAMLDIEDAMEDMNAYAKVLITTGNLWMLAVLQQ